MVEFLIYDLAISTISFLAKGSPPVKFTFNKDPPNVQVSLSISSNDNSPLNVFGSSKSIKQKEHLALHRLVIKCIKLIGSFLET